MGASGTAGGKWCADSETILEVSRALLQVIQDNDRLVVGSAVASLKALPGGVWYEFWDLSGKLAKLPALFFFFKKVFFLCWEGGER